ncbi:hypothetical protein GE09DRAFT_1057583 [Coniochaeta sp. 2T2.1]|nr:hypothetical protein GE09DRAFT_1057583 [Coniochaeta sp. 2T2.1]
MMATADIQDGSITSDVDKLKAASTRTGRSFPISSAPYFFLIDHLKQNLPKLNNCISPYSIHLLIVTRLLRVFNRSHSRLVIGVLFTAPGELKWYSPCFTDNLITAVSAACPVNFWIRDTCHRQLDNRQFHVESGIKWYVLGIGITHVIECGLSEHRVPHSHGYANGIGSHRKRKLHLVRICFQQWTVYQPHYALGVNPNYPFNQQLRATSDFSHSFLDQLHLLSQRVRWKYCSEVIRSKHFDLHCVSSINLDLIAGSGSKAPTSTSIARTNSTTLSGLSFYNFLSTLEWHSVFVSNELRGSEYWTVCFRSSQLTNHLGN